jgi:hypothetical protein
MTTTQTTIDDPAQPAGSDEPQIVALCRLILSGWVGIPIGGSSAPDALIYTRTIPGVVDSLFVKSQNRALATRQVMGQITATTEGTVEEVVDVAMSWSRVPTQPGLFW